MSAATGRKGKRKEFGGQRNTEKARSTRQSILRTLASIQRRNRNRAKKKVWFLRQNSEKQVDLVKMFSL